MSTDKPAGETQPEELEGLSSAPEAGDDTSTFGVVPHEKGKAKLKGTKGTRVRISDALWSEIRAYYESGSYSQRQLVNYARMRGIVVSQSAIAHRAMKEGWIKGKDREEIERKARQDIQDGLGETLREMLQRHTQTARIFQGEIAKHLQNLNDLRKTNPNAVLPVQTTHQLVMAMKEAQGMEARALGFDYNKGRPFVTDKDQGGEESGLKPLVVRTLTAEEEAEIRRKADEETAPA